MMAEESTSEQLAEHRTQIALLLSWRTDIEHWREGLPEKLDARYVQTTEWGFYRNFFSAVFIAMTTALVGLFIRVIFLGVSK